MSRNLKETPRSHASKVQEQSKDQDRNKGATEEDVNRQNGNTGMQEQLGHRDQNPELKDADSGLPG
jgi:hypothetical protein